MGDLFYPVKCLFKDYNFIKFVKPELRRFIKRSVSPTKV